MLIVSEYRNGCRIRVNLRGSVYMVRCAGNGWGDVQIVGVKLAGIYEYIR